GGGPRLRVASRTGLGVPAAGPLLPPAVVVLPVDPPGQARCLTRWGDPGLAGLVPIGKYHNRHLDDRLVEAAVALVGRWNPEPPPTWLTWIPPSTNLVEDFSRRLAARLGLEAMPALRRVTVRPPQKTMANSSQQAANILGAFEVTDVRGGP